MGKRLLFALFFLPVLAFGTQPGKWDLHKGTWQARLHRKDGADIIFNFEVKDTAGKKVIYILNAKDRLLVDDVKIQGDSVFIKMPFFDSEFKAAFKPNGAIGGLWIRHLADNDVSIPFTAAYGVKERFKQTIPAKHNVTGRWATRFASPRGDSSFAVGEFKQKGNTVYGTFLTSTGDYRFLEGIVNGDTLKLSTFDGSHAYYFTALIHANNTLENGIFYAGIGDGKEGWSAHRDEKAVLPDERTLATVKEGNSRLDFSFPDLTGEKVSISDERFRNKVVVITLMGSWCPNCMDETGYLSQWYKQNKQRGVEMIGLAYERTTDFQKSKKSLEGFLKRFDVTYPVLITGVTSSDPQKAEKTLPQLTAIKGFPTTIFIDKKGNVREVHTGFSGPGTGEHYEVFKKEFNQLLNTLISE